MIARYGAAANSYVAALTWGGYPASVRQILGHGEGHPQDADVKFSGFDKPEFARGFRAKLLRGLQIQYGYYSGLRICYWKAWRLKIDHVNILGQPRLPPAA